jgi:hypothetical protein
MSVFLTLSGLATLTGWEAGQKKPGDRLALTGLKTG